MLLRKVAEALADALEALGEMGEGFCVCRPKDRDVHKAEALHTGECREAMKALLAWKQWKVREPQMSESSIAGAIELLTAEEGASVLISCPNPDPELEEMAQGVEVTAEWTGWGVKHWFGSSLNDALQNALKAKEGV